MILRRFLSKTTRPTSSPPGFSLIDAARDLQHRERKQQQQTEGENSSPTDLSGPRRIYHQEHRTTKSSSSGSSSSTTNKSNQYLFGKDFFSSLNEREIQQSSLNTEEIELEPEIGRDFSQVPWWKTLKSNEAWKRPVELISTGKELNFVSGYLLSRFTSPSGLILPRWRTGLTAKQQRRMAKAVKKAKHLSILPYNEKFLPTFEADLPDQSLSNPLQGFYTKQTENFNSKRYKGKNEENIEPPYKIQFDGRRVMRRIPPDQILEENLIHSNNEIAFGIKPIDVLETEEQILQFLKDRGVNLVPGIHSVIDLKFECVALVFDQSTEAKLREFLESRGADVSDCVNREDVLKRAHLYLGAFEELVLGRKTGAFLLSLA